MDEGSGRRRTAIDRQTATRAGIAVGVAVILAAILGPSLLRTGPGPSPRPTGPVAVASPSVTPTPTPTSGPSPTPDPWSDLELEPYTPLAQLTSLDPDRLGFGPGSSFELRALPGVAATELAAGLRADPPLDLAVEAGSSDSVAIVRLAAIPDPGTRYRFRLSAPDGSLAGAWVFQARAALQVVATLPGDRAVGVPPNTGIEVTFDQDGTTGVPEHLSIEPPVAGRFEQHGRTWAFVPDEPLTPAVIYTVRLRAGVAVTGSVERLEHDVEFRFETGLSANRLPQVRFGRAIVEVRPNVQPDIAVWIHEDDDRPSAIPDGVTVVVHRLPTFAAVVGAAEALAGQLAWAVASPGAVVETAELTRVARVEATIRETESGYVLQVPATLAAGFYVLTIDQPGAPAQALLQVTNVSAYALTASRDMAVWVNDVSSGAPIAGSTVSISGGRQLGATDARGLLTGPTPEELRSPADPYAGDDEDGGAGAAGFLTVRTPDGRRLLLAIGLPTSWLYEDGTGWSYRPGNPDWWVAFFTDRGAYRQTDTIHVSGTVRDRDDRSVPGAVEVRLRPYQGSPDAPIIRRAVDPSSRGVFTADVRFEGLPRGEYAVDLFVGPDRVSTLWIRITEIRKPAYQIDVRTDRRAYIVGESVNVSARASFYDGSPVPAMDLRFEGLDEEATATTGADGVATTTFAAAYEGRPEGVAHETIGVAPAHPEEGQISGDRWLVVLPSSSWIAASGTVADGQVVVTGKLSRVDLPRLEAAIAAGGDLDPAGAAIGGGSVRAVVVHLIPVQTKIGTTYDFIEKKVVPLYRYSTRSEQIAATTLTTARDGTFRLSVPAPVPGDSYVITLTTQDGQGRRFVQDVYAYERTWRERTSSRTPYLEVFGQCAITARIEAGLGQPVDLTMHDGDGRVVDSGRLLFVVGSRGKLETTVQDEATFVRALGDADLPGFTVRAVWLGRGGYFASDVDIAVDPDDKAIVVTLAPDKARYRPGGTVTLDVTTTDVAGRPVAADVVLQGVDEKLYTLGMADLVDPLGELLQPVSPGFLRTYRSHAVPGNPFDGGCGDTGGGRDDFRDTVTFQRITTDASGRGRATFELSDDLTSWRMTAAAYSDALGAGVGTVQIPVGLPFFAEAVLAPEYLVGDEPVLLVRGYGDALGAGDSVQFSVSAPSLGLPPTTVTAAAFAPARVPLPRMTAGDHRVTIEAVVRQGERVRRDVLTRTVRVVESRLSALSRSFDALTPAWTPRGGEGLTRFVVTDVGRGRLLDLLDRLAWTRSGRFDRTLASEVARTILISEYGVPEPWFPGSAFDVESFQPSGIALLPYASPDLVLSAKTALVAPGLVDLERLRSALFDWDSEVGGGDLTRERRIVALAGRAGLGDDVAAELGAFVAADLTVMERLWLALGLAATGDEPAALAIERDLLAEHGQRLGPWVRLRGPGAVESEQASALLLLLAARLGDPIAIDVARFIADNPSTEHVFPLEEIGYVQAVLERLPRDPARFAWTVDGERHEQALRPGGSFTLVLTQHQWSELRLEALEGELGVSTAFESREVDLPRSPDLRVIRTVSPASGGASGLVRVSIEVRFGSQLPDSCYRLVDLVPSGLAPLVATGGWYDDEDGLVNGPNFVEGQVVAWCTSPTDRLKVYQYTARVVTPGTYRWEPAVVQWEEGPELGSATDASTYVIR